MTKKPALIIAALVGLSLSIPAQAIRRESEQGSMRDDLRSGKIKSPREVEAIVLPRMRGMQYLGPEYDSIGQVYRLKFIKGDRLIFVDVDARTGVILRQR
jgi:uncharacterized membrane protein YkoI